MCGIAGLLSLAELAPDRTLLGQMVQALQHRGPDEQGLHVDGPIGLGHKRLSILDLEGGQQPMHLPGSGLTIVFNGEIFNYLELRAALEQQGHVFLTRSDTEVILHLFLEHGPACVQLMNGQWAFAIWNAREQALFLARDRLGIRPLYYTVQGGFFAFASEVKALFRAPWMRREIDPRALADVFTFWHPLPPRTIFCDVAQLPPGCTLQIGRARPSPEITRYWQLDYRPEERQRSEQEAAEELRALLADATRLRLRADVAVGAYLSGGLDSSSTTALIRATSEAPLCSFSVAFRSPEFDEYEYQAEAARYLGTRHEVVRCDGPEICLVFPQVVWHAECPLVRTAPAPLFLLAERVHRQGYKVVLTGEGADEALGGYDIFKEAKIRRFWGAQPASRLRPLLLKRLYPYLEQVQQQPLEYLSAFFLAREADLEHPLFSHLPRWTLGARNLLFLADELKAALAARDPLSEVIGELPAAYAGWDPFAQAQYLETHYLLPGYILSSQGDRMAMAHSVEGRFPFLDYRVVEFGARISPLLKMSGLKEKYLLKRAMAGRIPQRIIARSKQPYRAPDAVSFFTPDGRGGAAYVDEVLAPTSLRASGLFNPAAVEKLVDKARKHRVVSIKDNMAFIVILSAQLIHEQFLR